MKKSHTIIGQVFKEEVKVTFSYSTHDPVELLVVERVSDGVRLLHLMGPHEQAGLIHLCEQWLAGQQDSSPEEGYDVDAAGTFTG